MVTVMLAASWYVDSGQPLVDCWVFFGYGSLVVSLGPETLGAGCG